MKPAQRILVLLILVFMQAMLPLVAQPGASGEAAIIENIHDFEQKYGPNSVYVGLKVSNLADYYYQFGKYDQATANYERALKIIEKAKPDSQKVLDLLNGMGDSLLKQNKLAEAAHYYTRLLQLWKKKLSPGDKKIYTTFGILSDIYSRLHMHKEFEEINKRRSAIEKIATIELSGAKSSWKKHLDAGTKLLEDGKATDAVKQLEAARQDAERIIIDDAPRAESYRLLGDAYLALGQTKKAGDFYNKGLQATREAFGSQSIQVPIYLGNQAQALFHNGQATESNGLLRQSIHMLSSQQGGRQQTLRMLASIGRMMADHPYRKDDAAAIYNDALSICQNNIPSPTAATTAELSILASYYLNLAETQRSRKEYRSAEDCYKRLAEIWQTVDGPTSPDAASCMQQLMDCYAQEGNETAIEDVYKDALKNIQQRCAAEHPATLEATCRLADVYRNAKKFDLAVPLYKTALSIMQKTLPPSYAGMPEEVDVLQHLAMARDFDKLEILGSLIDCTKNTGTTPELIALYEQAIAIMEKNKEDNSTMIDYLEQLADTYDKNGNQAKAEELYKRVVAIAEKQYGKSSLELALKLRELATHYSAYAQTTESEKVNDRISAIYKTGAGSRDVMIASIMKDCGTLIMNTNLSRDIAGQHHPSIDAQTKSSHDTPAGTNEPGQ